MKFFLDNNLPPAWAEALNALAGTDKHTVHHLRELFPPNVADVDWINQLASEGGWVVISGDLRITRNQHEREAWLRSGMVAFFMTKGWASLPFWERTWRVVRWWVNIVQQAELVTAPAGFEIPVNFGSGKFHPINLK